MNAKKNISLVIDDIIKGNFDDARLNFISSVFEHRGLKHNAIRHEPLVDYLMEYSKIKFGNNDEYVSTFDIYGPLPSHTRSCIEAINDAHNHIMCKCYNNAKRDLLAIATFLNKDEKLYSEYVAGFYTLAFMFIAESRQKNLVSNDTGHAFRVFMNHLLTVYPDRFNELAEIVFRDFKSVVLSSTLKTEDNLCVLSKELSPNPNKGPKNPADIDLAIDMNAKKNISLVINDIVKGNFDDARLNFISSVFEHRGLKHNAIRHEPLVDYLMEYSKIKFGNIDGYVSTFDIYGPLPSHTRSCIEAINDAHNHIMCKCYNNAKRDLLAVAAFLNKDEKLYSEYVAGFYTLAFMFITESRQKNLISNETGHAFHVFMNHLLNVYPDRFNELAEIVFRDFKSVVLSSVLKTEDNLSVLSKELSPNPNKGPKNPADIDFAIEKFNIKLNSLIGLSTVKHEVKMLVSFAKVNLLKSNRGIKPPNITKHLVFTGNPGTGKTTVSRLLSELYYNLGLLSSGVFIEADRSMLVAEYVGQTAVKTKSLIEKAKGGILFIDEAYSLSSNNERDFGNEAIETLLKMMEDYRADLMVIVAGYSENMAAFLSSNPGLSSRFSTTIHFEDYSEEELAEIFLLYASENEFEVTREAMCKIQNSIADLRCSKNFGNARVVRNLFDKTIKKHALRISSQSEISDLDLITIHEVDVE